MRVSTYNTVKNSLGKSQKVKSNTIFISIKNDCIQALKSLVGQNNVWFN